MMKERTMNLIEATDLRKTYRLSRRTSIDALQGVDIEIAAGEMVAIMGPSGSGKSTLMHLLGLLHAPDTDDGRAPTLRIDGVDATALSDGERTRIRARSMGFVFQSFNLVPTLTAIENITLPMALAKRPVDREWLDLVVETVGLGTRLKHRPSELSGGQQQRVAVARALASRPEIVFADEPTGNLDSRTGAEILSFMRTAVRELGQTVVMVTHDPVAASYSDRVVTLTDGRLSGEILDPTAESVFDHMKSLGAAAGRSSKGVV
jgi:putative ABC transport system ATP-binding protein